jgi:hypothetical protein
VVVAWSPQGLMQGLMPHEMLSMCCATLATLQQHELVRMEMGQTSGCRGPLAAHEELMHFQLAVPRLIQAGCICGVAKE